MAEHIRFVLTGAVLALGLAVSASADAQPGHARPMAAQPPELAIGVPAAQVQRFVLAAPDGGPEYRVSVWAPPDGKPPAAGYPVVYMLCLLYTSPSPRD